MKKVKKGFTLVELMIVVAIIGILAAIAIPNFLRYQLRTKAGERKINLEAIFKAQESLRQSERVLAAGVAPGQYYAFAAIPSTSTLGTSKMPWSSGDLATAQMIDWIVQGSTYAKYAAATTAVNGSNVAISMCAWSDIDGDGVQAGDGMWNPQIDQTGAAITNPPAAPCASITTGVHGLGYSHGADAMGRPVQLSADSVF